LMVHFGD